MGEEKKGLNIVSLILAIVGIAVALFASVIIGVVILVVAVIVELVSKKKKE